MGTKKALPKFRRLFNEVCLQIEQGVWKSGQAMLPLREYARLHQVSLNTAIRVYQELELHGWIKGKSRSGYTVVCEVKRVSVTEPELVSIKNLSYHAINATANPGYLALGSAYPNLRFPAIKQVYRHISREALRQSTQASSYSLPPGEPLLIDGLVRHFHSQGDIISSDRLLITNGAQEALTMALRTVTKAGDVVLIESPCFFGTMQALEALGLKALEIPASPLNGIDANQLEVALKRWPVKAILINPVVNNPQGYVMPYQQRLKCMQLATSFKIPLIEDLVFAELAYQSSALFTNNEPDSYVISCGSFSKSLDSRLRIGWLSGGRYHQAIEHLKYVTTMADGTLTQISIANYLASGHYPKHLRKARLNYQQNLNRLLEDLTPQLPEGSVCNHPVGGFLLWIKLPEAISCVPLFDELLDKKISIMPGCLFGMVGQFDSSIRLNYASYTGDVEQKRQLRVMCETIDRQLQLTVDNGKAGSQ